MLQFAKRTARGAINAARTRLQRLGLRALSYWWVTMLDACIHTIEENRDRTAGTPMELPYNSEVYSNLQHGRAQTVLFRKAGEYQMAIDYARIAYNAYVKFENGERRMPYPYPYPKTW